jgi:hypothetical protein
VAFVRRVNHDVDLVGLILGVIYVPKPKSQIPKSDDNGPQIDGNAGVRRPLTSTWLNTPVQRCLVHKLRNLEAHAPKRAPDELRADYHAITHASSLRGGQETYRREDGFQPQSGDDLFV